MSVILSRRPCSSMGKASLRWSVMWLIRALLTFTAIDVVANAQSNSQIITHNKVQDKIVQRDHIIQARQIYRAHGSDTMDCDDFCRMQDAVQFYYKYWKNTADYAQFKQRSHSQLPGNENTMPCCSVDFWINFCHLFHATALWIHSYARRTREA